jgi:hypothetical protein
MAIGTFFIFHLVGLGGQSMLFVEGKDIKESVVKHLEDIRKAMERIKPSISEEIEHWGTPRVMVIYSLGDYMSEVVVKVEPRYLKYLGLEIPQWLVKLMKIKQ